MRILLRTILGSFLIASLLMTTKVFAGSAKGPTTGLDDECKWVGVYCEDTGVFRTICIQGGYGNDCFCGSVSRPCSGVSEPSQP